MSIPCHPNIFLFHSCPLGFFCFFFFFFFFVFFSPKPKDDTTSLRPAMQLTPVLVNRRAWNVEARGIQQALALELLLDPNVSLVVCVTRLHFARIPLTHHLAVDAGGPGGHGQDAAGASGWPRAHRAPKAVQEDPRHAPHHAARYLFQTNQEVKRKKKKRRRRRRRRRQRKKKKKQEKKKQGDCVLGSIPVRVYLLLAVPIFSSLT